MDKHQVIIATLKSSLNSVIENTKINEMMIDSLIHEGELPENIKEELRLARARFFQARFYLTDIVDQGGRGVRIS